MEDFEYDQKKSDSNKIKHGIDFLEAQDLWLDDNCLEIKLLYPIEDRWFTIGLINNMLWTAIITKREKKIRLISTRRSRPEERKLYDSEKKKTNYN